MTERIERLQETLGEPIEHILRLQDLEANDPRSVIYVSGSLVEGHGHATSDVDVYVVGDAEARGRLRFEIENYQVAVDFGRNRRIDYEYWQSTSVETLAIKLAGLDLGRGFLAVLHDSEEAFIHRLRVGIPVTGPDGFRRLQALFDFSRLQRYLTTKAVREIDNVLDDLTGMLESQHLDVALFRAADLVGHVVDAWAHHAGSTNPSQKWRLKILEGLPPTARTRQVIESYWRLRFPDVEVVRGDPGACRDHIVRCIEFASDVTDWIQ